MGSTMQAISMTYRLQPKAWTGNGQELSFNINALPKKRGFSLHGGGLYCLYVITFAYTDMSLRKGLVQGGQCLGNSGPPPLPSFLYFKKCCCYRGLSPVITGPKSRPRPRTEPSTGFVFWATPQSSLMQRNNPLSLPCRHAIITKRGDLWTSCPTERRFLPACCRAQTLGEWRTI